MIWWTSVTPLIVRSCTKQSIFGNPCFIHWWTSVTPLIVRTVRSSMQEAICCKLHVRCVRRGLNPHCTKHERLSLPLCLSLPLSLYCPVLYCPVLYCTVVCCTVLYCTVLYCIVLYCPVLGGLGDTGRETRLIGTSVVRSTGECRTKHRWGGKPGEGLHYTTLHYTCMAP